MSDDRLRDALHELAAADAADVLRQARQAALARARSRLEDAYLEELLAAAMDIHHPPTPAPPVSGAGEGRGGRPEATADPPIREQAELGATEAWWTYCVLSAHEAQALAPQLEGIEPGSRVEVVSHDDLAALVSAVPLTEYGDEQLRLHLEDLGWVERTARRHEAVLDQALARTAIVPLRLCTLYRDQEGPRRLLRDQASSLAETLRRVEGCAEWGVKVFAGPDAGAAMTTAEETETSPGRPGATYLVRRQRERELTRKAGEVRARCAEAIHLRIAELAREASANPPQRPEVHGRDMAMLLNGVYLVPRDREDELHAVVHALEAEWNPVGFVIELTGPWPAYNFVSGEPGMVP
jgi:Gas vesicle synthesis protein GvpL/GvpF